MEQVFIPEEGRVCDAEEFLTQDKSSIFELRRQIHPKEGKRQLLCPECFQPLIISGTINQTFYFRHVKDSEACPIKTNSNLTVEEILAIKFNGQKEGFAHKSNKIFIRDTLVKDKCFENTYMEKTFREENRTGIAKRWRRPDVSSFHISKKANIVFELQVSTTFINVIIDREKFYQENNAYIAWVFLEFEATKFTELDIAFANKSNALVLDDDSKELCKKYNKLHFRCYYRKPFILDQSLAIDYVWDSALVSIDDLIFDESNMKLFYFDTVQAELEVENEIKDRKEAIRKEKEEILRLAKLEKNKPLFSYVRSEQSHNLRSYSSYKRPNQEQQKKLNPNKVNMKKLTAVCPHCNAFTKLSKVGRFLLCKQCCEVVEKSN